jgi:glycosyltransferase involved in cell wall biosynthesis
MIETQFIVPDLLNLPVAASGEAADRPYLSVILPVYNEEAVIAAFVEKLAAQLAQSVLGAYEIIVVDDGSTDQTLARLQQVAGVTLRLCRHPYNIGNGAAIKTGIRQARGEYLLLMDADGQHPVEDIPRLLAQAEQYDMVVGARTAASASQWHRDVANTIFNLFASYICGFVIRDLTSGFRLINAAIAKSFVYLLPNTFSYPTTLTLAVLRAGYSLTYVPIVGRARVGRSKIKPLVDGARFLTIIFRIAVFFAPLKVFLPISLLFFGTGFCWYLYRVFGEGRGFPPVSSLLMITSVIIFLIGLISEQITYLRYRQM